MPETPNLRPCGCGEGESCGRCIPDTCPNDIPRNYGVPGSDHYETCGNELCDHGKCSRCDPRCHDCPSEIDLKCHGCGIVYPNACQCPRSPEDDIAF